MQDDVSHPVSFYGATKVSNELMAHSYSRLYKIPITGLRFFTVYGPWGRPDMSPFLFTSKILASNPIDFYNHGNMERDFTYIDDIVEGVVRIVKKHLYLTLTGKATIQTLLLRQPPTGYTILDLIHQ